MQFLEEDFSVFSIEGLDERMTAIREIIQPKFQIIGQDIAKTLTDEIGHHMYLHIAKHARRTVNPPQDTWLAICDNKRGYKQHPHFQVGLFDDHLFIWIAYIYELPNKEKIASNFLNNLDQLGKIIPQDYVISQNHMQKQAVSRASIDLEKVLIRFRDIKKAELLIGKQIPATAPILKDSAALMKEIKNTVQQLIPIYRLSNTFIKEPLTKLESNPKI